MTARCASCHAPILWAVTAATGDRIPIDATTVPGGNIRLDTTGHPPVARIVGATIDLFDPTDDGTRWIAHFATCPQADEWRSR